jgi:hypothetical protein
MNQDRFSELFARQGYANTGLENLRGFMINPFANSMTPVQAAIYQLAYQQAQKEMETPVWLQKESLN